MIKSYEKEGYCITEYENGTIVKILISDVIKEEESILSPNIIELTNEVLLEIKYQSSLIELNTK